MYFAGPFQGKILDLGDLLVHLMVNETLFLLVIQVSLELTVRVGGIKGFAERGCIWEEKMFSRDIVE